MRNTSESPKGGEESLNPYLRDMGPKNLLTAQEEVALAKTIDEGREQIGILSTKRRHARKRGTIRKLGCEIRSLERAVAAARKEMIQKNLRLVISVARRYTRCGMPLPDLIQEGNIGLMRAVEKFDYRMGNRFATYAVWWIRQAITRALSDRSRTIRIPVHVVAEQSKLARTWRTLFHELGREPTPEECAQEMSLSPERVEALSQLVSQPISLEKPVGEDGGACLGEFVADDDMPNPGEAMMQNHVSDQVQKVLATLTPREEKILRMRYGIGEKAEYTLEEVGKTFCVTRERIRQIEEKALKKLGRGFRGQRLKAVLD